MEKQKKKEAEKAAYEKPEVDVFEFESDDIMVLSGHINEGSIYEL